MAAVTSFREKPLASVCATVLVHIGGVGVYISSYSGIVAGNIRYDAFVLAAGVGASTGGHEATEYLYTHALKAQEITGN